MIRRRGEQLLPSASFPREVAGASVAADAVNPAPARTEYGVDRTDTQWNRLLSIFPAFVCDYSKPGVGQQPPAGTWLNFS